ncbi:MAG: hypothetical protein P1P82_14455 [Bacteroidales bacterium]|nr:hypothetical protein [Bacteroidales bacterium]MDT8430925.1 hypothetical protein [Bacteroidales bacterium]
MLLRTVILLIIIAASTLLQAQHDSFIGKTKEEVQEKVKTAYREFGQDNTVVSQQFNYLKYVNASQTITWIIYFTDEDVCRSTKKVCDYMEYDDVLKALDAQYERTGDMQWEYSSEGETFAVLLKEEDWYFTVREQRKQ